MSQSDNISSISASSYNSNDLEDIINIQKDIVYEPDCIRKKSNWTKSDPSYKLDSDTFDQKLFLKGIKSHSPKLDALLKKIKELDKADQKRDGEMYKHFIFCDVKSSSNGARMLASAFVSNDYTLGYEAMRKGEKKAAEKIEKIRPDTPRPSDKLEYLKNNIPKSFSEMEKIIEEEDSDEDDENEKTLKSPKTSGSKKRGGAEPKKKRFQKIELLSKNALKKTKNNNFYLLSSVDVFDQPISVATKKEMLANFNARPSNVHGEEIRFIIMDSGFKEGIDLFDIKYVHIFEPPVNAADLKQVVGRGTRTCGQQGLQFHPTKGWPLNVYIYDVGIPRAVQSQFQNSTTAFDFYLKSLNMDMKLVNFASDLEKVAIYGAVDYELNKNVHEFSVQTGGGPKKKIPPPNNLVINGPPVLVDPSSSTSVVLPSGTTVQGMEIKPMNHSEMRKYIHNYFSDTKWENVKMENMCDESAVAKKKGGSKVISYTPTQRFIKKYFTPQAPVSGMLLWHSTGTGKTCSAIAAATSSFARQGYTILWVTRTTLKNDIWKNMFDLICNEEIRAMVADGVTIPREQDKRMKLLSDAWKIRPISYKQFSNLVSKGNSYYQRLVDINGSVDPLRKTLLIIDEAHKLYGGGDLSSIERPNMEVLHDSLMNSYAISGRLSVRVLLMTATPITENPMELVKLVNLCKPREHQIVDKFPLFSNEYLNSDGGFTQSGKSKFLDTIAGYISYLNREKDARQFAQPHLEDIVVPMIKDVNEVKELDKRLNREIINREINKIKNEIDEENNKIDDDFKDLESSRFFELRDICEEYDGLVKKGCLKIANNNIRELIKEAKTYTKDIKDKIKEIKEQLKKKNAYRKQVMSDIKSRYEKNPQRLLDFQNGLYYVLKYSCAKTVKKNKSVDKLLSDNPQLEMLKAEISIFDEKIKELDISLKIMIEKQKIKIKELRKMLKDGELNKLETFVVRDSIKKQGKLNTSLRKTRKLEIRNNKKDIRKSRNKLSRKLTRLTAKLKKQIQDNAKDQKIDKKERKKLKTQMTKSLRKQGRIREEFKDGIIKDLVKKYKENTEKDFLEEKKALEKKQKEKQEEKEKKEKEREKKRLEKEKEREKKNLEKEKERKKKKLEKEKQRETKKREKEAEKKKKELNKTKKKR